MSNVIQDVIKERKRQDDKWGEQNRDVGYWFRIIIEELGEASKASMEVQLLQYRKEMIETAASCIAAVECFDRNNGFVK